MSDIKSVLLLAHPENDFLQQTIWKGLVQVLGNQNVAVLPDLRHFRGVPDTWYVLSDGKQGCTGTPSHLKPETENGWTRDRILDSIGDFDAMLLCSTRPYALASLDMVRQLSVKKPPLIAMCGEDYGWSSMDEEVIRRFRPKVYFKRELDRVIEGVYPLPFAAFTDAYPVDDQVKRYSVYAAFGNTWSSRMELVKRLGKMGLADSYIGTNSDFISPEMENVKSLETFDEYMKGIAQSKISFVMRGFGRDTLRAWEATVFETCVFWCDPGILIPHPFEDKVHVVKYPESLEGLESLVHYYLAHDEERMAIAQRGKAHARQYHTTKARAEYFLDIVSTKIQGRSYAHA